MPFPRLRRCRRRPRSLVALLAPAVALSAPACQVRGTVDLEVAEDGSGRVTVEVTLDDEAVARLPDLDGDGVASRADLAAMVRTDDLATAGWEVGEPVAAGGGARLRVSRRFGTPAEAERLLAQVTGSSGVLRDARVTRAAGFGRTEVGFTGTLDLQGGIESFGDEGLAAALDGEPVGEDASAIEARLGRPLADAVRIEVVADLAGAARSWSPRLGAAPVELRAERTVWDVPVLILAAVAAVAAAALAVLLASRSVRRRRA